MGDIVRDNYDKSLGQRKVVFQQQKPLLNYELNLAQDIIANQTEEILKSGIGDNYYGDSFQVQTGTNQNEIRIKKGIFYHKGIPFNLTKDRLFGAPSGMPAAPAVGVRKDYVFVEYEIVQVDSPADPAIGFVTTREDRLDYEIKVSQGALPNPPAETIFFNNVDNSITLTRGFFPDWMRIQGSVFTTTSASNEGDFTVASSPNPKKIFVDETVSTETLDNVIFRLKTTQNEIPKEYKAYRKDFFIIAELLRAAGNQTIDNIVDTRDKVVYNYVIEGCDVIEDTGLNIDIVPGSLLVGDESYWVEDNQPSLTLDDEALNYVYMNASGVVEVETSEPTDFHVMLSEMRTSGGSVVNKVDQRRFVPIAWSNKYGQGSGTGETDGVSITAGFRSDDVISKYDAVFISSNGSVSKADASSRMTMPVIGISNANMIPGDIDAVVTYGVIENPLWNWTAGEIVYMSTSSGDLISENDVQTVLGAGDYVQRVAVAINQRQIFVNPDKTLIKKDGTAEVPIVTMRENGELEIIRQNDKISADRLSFLAPIVNEGTQSFIITEGRYFIDGNNIIDFSEKLINMGTGIYQTSAIPSSYFNKVYFTGNSDGDIVMYEGIPASTLASVEDPIIPENELPIAMFWIQDDSNGNPGTILPLSIDNLYERRSWLNTGSTDNAAFKTIFYNENSVYVSKGEGWFNKYYISMDSPQVVNHVGGDGTFYVYLNLNNTTGTNLEKTANNASFTISSSSPGFPSQIDKRNFIPLARYEVSSGVINRNSFKSYLSKFWEYRDSEFEDEYVIELADTFGTTQIVFNPTFNFIDEDNLKITINGVEVYEDALKDYTKDGTAGTVTFNYPITAGAEVRIRKV